MGLYTSMPLERELAAVLYRMAELEPVARTAHKARDWTRLGRLVRSLETCAEDTARLERAIERATPTWPVLIPRREQHRRRSDARPLV